jgi:hypothetical protein
MPVQPTQHSLEVPVPEAVARSRQDLSGALLAVGIVGLCFLLYAARPFSVLSDIGYQAFSARQYVDHYTPVFASIRLADTRDIARDTITPLMAWSPSWPALFTLAFKAGLSTGTAARVLSLLFSLAGALGWVRVASLVGLRGGWRIAGIALASLYCLRRTSVTTIGAGDLVVYAVAPWLLVAGAALSVPLSSGPRKRIVARTLILCFALGLVYWLKYTGMFLSIAILIALLIEQFGSFKRARRLSSLMLIVFYGAAFAAPAIALKIYNYSRSGSDFIEATAQYSRPRTPERLLYFIQETAYHAAPVLFSAAPGLQRIVGDEPSIPGWLLRAPGILLLFLILYLTLRRPPSWIGNITVLCAVVPLVIFPLLSFATGPHFTIAIGRCTDPYWILLEMMTLGFLSERPPAAAGLAPRRAWNGLALAVSVQLILFLWIPFSDAKEIWFIFHSPAHKYQTTAADLWDTDLSRYGTRDIVASVKSLVRSPADLIVPAVYSDRAYATDTMLEFAGNRLLPLNIFPLVKTHGVPGSNYYASEPFRSSIPLRIILVAPDPYNRADFLQSTKRVMSRFPQVRHWDRGPVDPHGRVWIWVGETG